MAIDRSTSEPVRRADGRRQALVGIGAAAISLFLLPPVFGAVGVVFGARAIRLGEQRLGFLAIALAVALATFSTWLALTLVHRL